MKNMSIQPLWLTHFIEILLVLEFLLTKTYFGTFSYKAHFRPQISSNVGVNGLLLELVADRQNQALGIPYLLGTWVLTSLILSCKRLFKADIHLLKLLKL